MDNSDLFLRKFSREDMNIFVDYIKSINGIDQSSIAELTTTNHSYLISCIYNGKKIVIKATKQHDKTDIDKNFLNSELLLLKLKFSSNFVNVIKIDGKDYHIIGCGKHYICFFAMPFLTCAQGENNTISSVVKEWIHIYGKDAVATYFTEQLLSALNDARKAFSVNFVICDIKLSNLLISPGTDKMYKNHILISDIGSCHQQNSEDGLTIDRQLESTPQYRDIFTYMYHGNFLDSIVDIFAVAVCAYKILTSLEYKYGRFFYPLPDEDLSYEEKSFKTRWLSGNPVEVLTSNERLKMFISDATMYRSDKRIFTTPEKALSTLYNFEKSRPESIQSVFNNRQNEPFVDEEATIDTNGIKKETERKNCHNQFEGNKKLKTPFAFAAFLIAIIVLTILAYTTFDIPNGTTKSEANSAITTSSIYTTQIRQEDSINTTIEEATTSICKFDFSKVAPDKTILTTKSYNEVKTIKDTAGSQNYSLPSKLNDNKKKTYSKIPIIEEPSSRISINEYELFDGYLRVNNPDDSFCDFENGGIKATVNQTNIPTENVCFSVEVFDSTGHLIHNCSSYYGTEDYSLPYATCVIGFDEDFSHGKYRAVLDLFFNGEKASTDFWFEY